MDNKEKEDILQRYYSKDNNPAAYSGSHITPPTLLSASSSLFSASFSLLSASSSLLSASSSLLSASSLLLRHSSAPPLHSSVPPLYSSDTPQCPCSVNCASDWGIVGLRGGGGLGSCLIGYIMEYVLCSLAFSADTAI